MDPQPLIPDSSSPFASPSGGGGRSPITGLMIAVLALGTIGFGVATVIFAGRAGEATKNLDSKIAAAVKVAKAQQKKADDEANTKANESPYRAYTAPSAFGSFVVSFPKNWSSYADEESSGTQVSLVLNPDFVRKTNGVDNLMATRVMLLDQTKTNYMSRFNGQVKNGQLKQVDTKVSGQPAYDLTGAFNDKKTVRLVVVPIRDKVLVFSSENASYASEFNQILAQAKVIP